MGLGNHHLFTPVPTSPLSLATSQEPSEVAAWTELALGDMGQDSEKRLCGIIPRGRTITALDSSRLLYRPWKFCCNSPNEALWPHCNHDPQLQEHCSRWSVINLSVDTDEVEINGVEERAIQTGLSFSLQTHHEPESHVHCLHMGNKWKCLLALLWHQCQHWWW